jgi:hypothetical protein
MPPPQAFVRTGRAARLRTIVAKETAPFGPGFLRSGSAANVTLTTRPYLAVIQRSVFRDEGSAYDPLLLAPPSKHPTVFGRHPEERLSRRRISLRFLFLATPFTRSAPGLRSSAPEARHRLTRPVGALEPNLQTRHVNVASYQHNHEFQREPIRKPTAQLVSRELPRAPLR